MDFAGGYHDPSHLQVLHHTSPYPSRTSSTTAAYGVLFLIFIYYVLQYLDYTNLPMSELLWNSLVYITPSQILSALDSGFGTAMAHDAQNDSTGFNSKGHASKSNTMRRIFGLDGTGILTTIQRTRTISNVGSVFKARPSNSLPGLGNWDNSCYQNSVLQGLAALESLPAFLRSNPAGTSGPTQKALNETIARLNDPANVGKTFWTPAELKSMSSWQQQDAQEYFSKISDELEKDTAKAANKRPGSSGLETLLGVERSDTRTSSPETTSVPRTSSIASSEDTIHVERLPEEVASLIVRNPLEGLLAQRVGCQQCGYVEGLSLVPFNCLTVPLGRQWMYDVRSCLDEYTALEPINGVECAKCTLLRAKQQMEQLLSKLHPDTGEGEPAPDEATKALRLSLRERLDIITQALEDEDFSDQLLKKCQIPSNKRVSTTKTRQAVIARSPSSLVVHVNRSNFDELTGVQSKNSATVRFPQQLDLAPWCLGRDPSSDNEDDSVETWNVDPSKSMLSTEDSIEKLDFGKMYELRAVITHYGRHENGHYICYRRSPYSCKPDVYTNVESSTTPWWRLSDEDVTEVDEDTVLAQGGVFMLFYEQVAPLTPEEAPRPVLDEPKAELQTIAEEGKALDPTQVIDVPEMSICDDSQSVKLEQEELASASAHPANLVSLQAPTEGTGSNAPVVENPEPQEAPKVNPVATIRDPSQPLCLGSPKTPLPAASEARPSSPAPAPAPQPKTIAKVASPERKEVAVEPAEPATQVDTHKENQPVSPTSMRTAGPRNSRSSGSRAGKAMGSVAGFVQAN
ncbi:hypothetical protein HO173_010242 [Letharia columbiana]|uniref:ubiquitinyl hydrolase 1 n=1 Tax=Letharia columbiana TaxID=112416 RepID=A0A8H6FMX1_9LECA|nr:uncharacterized protein HO173_010242 [Letharia columbiana]KAF6231490.1 hypothetical protein HO173_010242 [Letharia columbiana]